MGDFGPAVGGGITESIFSEALTPAYGSESGWSTLGSFSDDVVGIWLSVDYALPLGQHGGCIVDIAVGSTSTIIITDLLIAADDTNHRMENETVFIPIEIPRSTNIYARGKRSNVSSAYSVAFAIQGMPKTLGNKGLTGSLDTYGIDTTNCRGVAVSNNSSTPYAWGGWAQIAASTTRDARYMLIAAGHYNETSRDNSSEYFIQVGVGSSGNEKVIIDNDYYRCHHLINHPTPKLAEHFVHIPAGSRIAIRMNGNQTAYPERMLDFAIYLGT